VFKEMKVDNNQVSLHKVVVKPIHNHKAPLALKFLFRVVKQTLIKMSRSGSCRKIMTFSKLK